MLSKLLPTLRRTLACTLPLLAATTLAQTTINVGPGQTYTTIQSGINAANSGDTVLVAPNSNGNPYYENINFNGKAITLQGSGSPFPIIDGSGAGPVVTISGASASGASLTAFTIQNGGKPQSTGGPQGAIYINGASVTLHSNTVTNAFCSGINSINGNLVMIANIITHTLTTGCTAGEGVGSGIVIAGGAAPTSNAPAIFLNGNGVSLNTASVAAPSDKGGGAAINITGVTTVPVYIDRNILNNNTTTGYGGALYVANTPSFYLLNTLVFGNKGISGGLDIVVPGSSDEYIDAPKRKYGGGVEVAVHHRLRLILPKIVVNIGYCGIRRSTK